MSTYLSSGKTTHYMDSTTSKCTWIQLHSLPIQPAFVSNIGGDRGGDDTDYTGFWVISKSDNVNLTIFNYTANENKFTQYLHDIEPRPMKILAISYDKQNKILYIISSVEIIVIDLQNNVHKSVDKNKKKTLYNKICSGANIIQQILINCRFYNKSYFAGGGLHLHTYPSIFYLNRRNLKNNKNYTLFFHNRIILRYKIGRERVFVFSNVELPFVPNNPLLLKQSTIQTNLLMTGYMKLFIKTRIIPMDVIHLLTNFYLWYNLHLFDNNGNQYAISIDKIINNSQKYTGIVQSYNKTNNTVIIQIKGKIDEFYKRKCPRIKLGADHDKPTKVQKPLINALTNIFDSFATNDDNTMSMADMRKYILHCGVGENSASSSRIKSIFITYGKSETKLNIRGFIDFYCQALMDRPDYVMNDLTIFGYKDGFKPTGECIHGSLEDYILNDENKLVDFAIKINEDGTRNAVNITTINASRTFRGIIKNLN